MTPGVLISGAAHGIGRAVVDAALAAGHEVIAVDHDEILPSVWADDARVTPVLCDLTDADETTRIVTAALAGRELSGVVNNAGAGASEPFHSTSTADWERLHALNLRAPFLVSRAAWDALRKPGGAIVHVSSVHGAHALAGLAAYASSKAGLEGLTRAMALDAAPHGVRVNAVAPGFVRTRLWTDWLESLGPERASVEEGEIRAMIPLGRPAEPEEVAEAVLWLLGPRSSYVSGTTLAIDGAISARAAYRADH